MNPDPDYEHIARLTMELLEARGPDKSICPSEVARALDETRWRDLMAAVRHAAAELLAAGKIRVTAGDSEVHPLELRGPIRLRLPE